MEYVKVHLIDLPIAVEGYTVRTGPDEYAIFINAKLSDEQQRKTYDHEIAHIDNGDLEYIYDVDVLEGLLDVV